MTDKAYEGQIFIGTFEVLETGAEITTAVIIEMTDNDDGQDDAAWRKALDFFLLDDGGLAMLKRVEYWKIATITDQTPIPRVTYEKRRAAS